MYIILTYDVSEKKVGKTCKKLREYLNWSQNSVFEGEITSPLLEKCLFELEKFLDFENDSISLYIIENPKHLKRKYYGVKKIEDDVFI